MSEVIDGRSTRWDEHRAARRAELVHAASRAVHRGGPDVSMDEIAAAAGTSKSIIYRYFTDRTGLQLAIGSSIVARMHDTLADAARSATSPRDALRTMAGVYLETIENSPNVYYFVTRTLVVAGNADSGHGPSPLDAFVDSVIEIVAGPFTDAAHVPAADAAAWAAGAVGFVRGAGEWWLSRRGQAGVPDRDALAEAVTSWLWSGPVGVMAPGDDAEQVDSRRRAGGYSSIRAQDAG